MIVVAATIPALSTDLVWSASALTKVTIHIPSKSLSLMPFYLGKDKGFFAEEGIEVELVLMAPPIAIAALVSGELHFSTTLGAGTSAIMQGHPLKRIIYVQQDLTFALTALPEIKSIHDLKGKVIAVNAPTDATGMSATAILKGNGVNPSGVTFLATQITENSYRALMSRKVQAAILPPPYAEEAQAKGFTRLAEAKDFAPLSTIGLIASIDYLNRNPSRVQSVLRALLKTLAYLHNQKNRSEVIRYIIGFHKIDHSVAEKAFTTMLAALSHDGTKPREAVQREIEIYRETLKIAKSFTPEVLEDLSHLRQAQASLRESGR